MPRIVSVEKRDEWRICDVERSVASGRLSAFSALDYSHATFIERSMSST